MPSSTPDDYARLKAPWKPIDKASIKHIIHAGVENDPGNKVGNLSHVWPHQVQE